MPPGEAVINYANYETILNTSALEWVAFGYLIHIGMAAIQSWIIASLLVAAAMNISGSKEHSKLQKFGVVTTPQHGHLVGAIQVLAALALLTPLALNASALFTLLGSLLAVVAVFLVLLRHKLRGQVWSASITLALTFVLCIFGLYERRDPLQLGIELAFSAKTFRDKEIAWQLEQDPMSPKVGQMAPDFELATSEGSDGVRLSDYLHQDKPVVLFFGANSCPAFSEGSKGINRLHQKYGDRVHFLGVYVKEPHPTDEWWLAPSKTLERLHESVQSRAAVDIEQPKTQAQRNHIAARAKTNLLNERIPLLVDTIDNKVNNAWTGQPTRIYFLSPQGKVLYNPGTGPYAFNPEYLEPVIEGYLN